MARFRTATLLVATLAATACASAPSGPVLAAAPLPRSFGLRAGDMVRVRIWREPDLSGDFIVDEYGRVTLPLIGAKQVVGESSESLQKKLETEFAASVKEPSVQVVFLRRISVQGAVRNPGLYPMDATMTVGDALAMAGGRNPRPLTSPSNSGATVPCSMARCRRAPSSGNSRPGPATNSACRGRPGSPGTAA